MNNRGLKMRSSVRTSVIVELSIIPIGEGVSVSKFLIPALKELEKHGLKYNITPMCTVFEARSVEDAFRVVEAAHEAVFKIGAKRVVTTVKIDDRRDVRRGMEEKVKSLEKAIREA